MFECIRRLFHEEAQLVCIGNTGIFSALGINAFRIPDDYGMLRYCPAYLLRFLRGSGEAHGGSGVLPGE
jgi:hypothetical protein